MLLQKVLQRQRTEEMSQKYGLSNNNQIIKIFFYLYIYLYIYICLVDKHFLFLAVSSQAVGQPDLWGNDLNSLWASIKISAVNVNQSRQAFFAVAEAVALTWLTRQTGQKMWKKPSHQLGHCKTQQLRKNGVPNKRIKMVFVFFCRGSTCVLR